MPPKQNKSITTPDYKQLELHNQLGKQVIFNPTSNVNYKSRKHSITMAIKKNAGVNLLDKKDLFFSKSGRSIHPEFLPYFMTMKEGCAKKLLLYIIFHELDIQTLNFIFDTHLIQQFNRYCERIGLTSYKEDVIKQAIRDIVDANIAISIQRKVYMINPLIISSTGKNNWQLINTYISHLNDKGKSIDANFFPRYAKK